MCYQYSKSDEKIIEEDFKKPGFWGICCFVSQPASCRLMAQDSTKHFIVLQVWCVWVRKSQETCYGFIRSGLQLGSSDALRWLNKWEVELLQGLFILRAAAQCCPGASVVAGNRLLPSYLAPLCISVSLENADWIPSACATSWVEDVSHRIMSLST